MLKLGYLLLLLAALAAAKRSSKSRKLARIVSDADHDKVFRIEELLTGVGTDDVYKHEHKSFPYTDASLYMDGDIVANFTRYWDEGFLVKYGVFTLNCKRTIRDTDILYRLFNSTKDFDTFYKVASWAKDEVHAGMYVHALIRALADRPDTYNLPVPGLYQIVPSYFLPAYVVHQARSAHMHGVGERSFVMNNTGYEWSWHHSEPMMSPHIVHRLFKRDYDVESRLSYFREDVDWLDFVYKMFVRISLSAPEMVRNGTVSYRLGEIRYRTLHYLLARYNLERYAVGLPPVEPLDFHNPIKTGYDSQIASMNGRIIPGRPDDVVAHVQNPQGVERLLKIVRRYFNVIESSHVRNESYDSGMREIGGAEGTNVLGNLMIGGYDDYYPSLYFNLLALVDSMITTTNKYATGTLLNTFTMARDPAFYQVLAYIDRLFDYYHISQKPYSKDEISFPGVTLEEVDISQLETYFEMNDFNVSNLVPGDGGAGFRASQFRLGRKDFSMSFRVKSQVETEAVVRVFLGPASDAKNKTLNLNDYRRYLLPYTAFPVKLQKGTNIFKKEAPLASKSNDGVVYTGREQCTYPDNLILPMGSEGGTAYKFYVIIHPSSSHQEVYDRSCVEKVLIQDTEHSLNYPIDRFWNESLLDLPNHRIVETFVYHTDIRR